MERTQDTEGRRIYLVGVGMGAIGTLTLAGRDAIAASALVIGAPRILAAAADAGLIDVDATRIEAVRTDEIVRLLTETDATRASVLFSGDIGFYSGATLLEQRLSALVESGELSAEVQAIPGISSLSYLCARLGVPWQDAYVVSLHGRLGNPVGVVQTHEKTFFLTGGATKAQDVCRDLAGAGLGHVRVCAGERLSYPDERLVRGTAAELATMAFDDLAVLLVLNPHPIRRPAEAPGIADDAFVRDGRTPMTKQEVRALVVSKLRLRSDSVVWDVGAGTGSVSVEAAFAASAGQVYAVERDEAALALLEKNRERFSLTNLHIVAGVAPAALRGLPVPDRVFVGGSAGGLDGIVDAALAANPRVRIVATCVTLETVGTALAAFGREGMTGLEVIQVGIARSREAGPYHLMAGQNPVYLFSAEGTDAS